MQQNEIWMVSEISSFSTLYVPSLRKTEQRDKNTATIMKKRKILISFHNGSCLPRKIKVICKSPFQFKNYEHSSIVEHLLASIWASENHVESWYQGQRKKERKKYGTINLSVICE